MRTLMSSIFVVALAALALTTAAKPAVADDVWSIAAMDRQIDGSERLFKQLRRQGNLSPAEIERFRQRINKIISLRNKLSKIVHKLAQREAENRKHDAQYRYYANKYNRMRFTMPRANAYRALALLRKLHRVNQLSRQRVADLQQKRKVAFVLMYATIGKFNQNAKKALDHLPVF